MGKHLSMDCYDVINVSVAQVNIFQGVHIQIFLFHYLLLHPCASGAIHFIDQIIFLIFLTKCLVW